MSVQTLYTAATGMTSLQNKLDVIANNLANVETTGVQAEPGELRGPVLPATRSSPAPRTAPASTRPRAFASAWAAACRASRAISPRERSSRHRQRARRGHPGQRVLPGHGPHRNDLLHAGPATSRRTPTATSCWPRPTSAGCCSRRSPSPRTPRTSRSAPKASSPSSSPATSSLPQVGQIELANFINPEGLLKLGENLYAADRRLRGARSWPTPASKAWARSAGHARSPTSSPSQELIDLITTQRSFEMNSQAVKAGDQSCKPIDNLRVLADERLGKPLAASHDEQDNDP